MIVLLADEVLHREAEAYKITTVREKSCHRAVAQFG